LESIASGSGILNQIRTRLAAGQASCLSELALGGELSTDDVFRAADARDRLACEVTGRAISALEIGLTNLVNLLNPEKIVCGGGVVESGWYIQRVALAVAAGVPPGGHASFGGLFLSQLNPSQVGMIGAATIAWEGIEMTTPGKS
jgi:glucokinase